ncbi:MAG TPA: PA2169 family four-helix-bundle protein [Steroidobacteraceae bacterium]|nr:PA2169 family four-helix-bundle protein [Steroidobacteraceae bacterium]
MNQKYTIAALRELIAVRRDSEQALRMCSSSLAPGQLRELCVRSAGECAEAIRELEALVRRLGGERQAHWPVAGFCRSRSGWAGLRAALARGEERAILDACERGESWILEAYRNALDDHLPDSVRDAVLRQFEALMSTHDAIRGCRSLRVVRGDAAAAPGAQAGQL